MYEEGIKIVEFKLEMVDEAVFRGVFDLKGLESAKTALVEHNIIDGKITMEVECTKSELRILERYLSPLIDYEKEVIV